MGVAGRVAHLPWLGGQGLPIFQAATLALDEEHVV
jgi:hypothetical protein